MLRSALLVASALTFAFAGTQAFGQAQSGSDPTKAGRTWELGQAALNPQESDQTIDDAATLAYLQRVVDDLVSAARAKPVRVRLTRSDQEYATLSPKRVLSISGALANRLEDEAQLAGLVAHELAHRDSGDQSCVLASLPACSPHDQREHELTATTTAISILKVAGYDPEPLLSFLSKLAYEHPAWGAAINPDDLLQLRLQLENETAPLAGYRIDSSAFLHFHAALEVLLGKPLRTRQ